MHTLPCGQGPLEYSELGPLSFLMPAAVYSGAGTWAESASVQLFCQRPQSRNVAGVLPCNDWTHAESLHPAS
jgi:hypothetical protein